MHRRDFQPNKLTNKETDMTLTKKLMTGAATAALTLGAAAPAFAAEKWDMPMAYSASNFHSEKCVAFA